MWAGRYDGVCHRRKERCVEACPIQCSRTASVVAEWDKRKHRWESLPKGRQARRPRMHFRIRDNCTNPESDDSSNRNRFTDWHIFFYHLKQAREKRRRQEEEEKTRKINLLIPRTPLSKVLSETLAVNTDNSSPNNCICCTIVNHKLIYFTRNGVPTFHKDNIGG